MRAAETALKDIYLPSIRSLASSNLPTDANLCASNDLKILAMNDLIA
jgi:hypothetical protein